MTHLAQHILKPELRSDNTLHVVGVVSNPAMYQSRYRLARDWVARTSLYPNVKVYLVEASYGDRQHELEFAGVEKLELKTNSEIWIKENMINLGVRHLLPSNWKYLAWLDTDIAFANHEWAQATLHELQHFAVIQPWQSCVDLDYHGSVYQTHSSFGYVTQNNPDIQTNPFQPYRFGHPGFAWACTRAFYEQVEGLIDFAILGSGDHHQAFAMLGRSDETMNRSLSKGYQRRIIEWQNRAVRITQKEVGYIPGRIEHHWHGAKKNRYYRERWQILVEHKFDPDKDLMRDSQGLFHIVGKPGLEQDIRRYNRSRKEDGSFE